MIRYNARRRVSQVLSAAVAAIGVFSLPAVSSADTFTYINNSTGQTGTWTAGNGWDVPPASGNTTSLILQNVSTGSASITYDAATTNDIATVNPGNGFQLNQLTLNGAGLTTGFSTTSGTGLSRITTDGNALIFTGVDATVYLNATGVSATNNISRRDDSSSFTSASFKIKNTLVLQDNVAFTGNGNAHFELRGAITGNGTLTKTGTSYLDVTGAAGSSYAGNVDVQDGRFRVSGGSAAGTYSWATTGNLNVGANGNVDSLDGNMGVGSLSGTGSLWFQTTGGLRSIVVNYNGQSADQFNGTIKGLTMVIQNGTGVLDLTHANTSDKLSDPTLLRGGYNAYWGTLIANGNAGSEVNSNAVHVTGGTVELHASTNTGVTGAATSNLYTGTMRIVSDAAAGTDLAVTGQYSGTAQFRTQGGTLVLDRGTGNSLTFTVGKSGQATSALATQNNGGLTLVAAHGLSQLGVTEKLTVAGTTPTVTNGMVTSQWIGQDTDSQKSGEFLTYDAANGLVALTAANYDLANTFTGSTNVSKVNISAATAVDSDATAFALKNSNTITIASGKKLTLGATAGHAGVILNGGTITGGTLAFGTQDGYIYTSLANGRIDSTLTSSSTNGVTLNGPGTVTLGNINMTGKLAINSGAVHVTMDAAGTKLSGSNTYLMLKGGVLESSGAFNRALGTANGTVNMAGPIAGFAAQGGDLTVSLGGGNSTVTWGETSGFLTTGVLQFGSLTADHQVVWNNNISLGSDIANYNRIINVLAGTGTASGKITGNITSAGALNTLVKDGDGTLILAGTNTYAGRTLVANGVLRVDGSSSGQGDYTVNAGATLAGNGTIGLSTGKKIIVSGVASKLATLQPGAGADVAGVSAGTSVLSIGSDSADSTVVLGDYSALAITLAGNHFDRLNISGNLDLSSLLDSLTLNVTGPLTQESYTIVHYTGNLLGTFDDTSSLATYGLGIVYDTAAGNINLVSAVPEPASLLLMALGIGGCALKRRRK